jgi:hypothetical protein
MESKSPLGGNLPGGLIFTSPAPVLITKTEGTARLSLNDLAENRHIIPQLSCAASDVPRIGPVFVADSKEDCKNLQEIAEDHDLKAALENQQ